ncbi:hypothetical protein AMTRI_Chr02g215310 [Amborella trichopoda]|uniref:Peptidase A1 domain-containing protein n=1 Tax=Amborella trichopoda TaxID=13333 RepID=U5D5L5_AMBTC|nr:aspartic proteinase CDR1 [Amborella trichopoda]ERN16722.1 hypothetical protein AMTR_s00183p00037900 [Amborella trichopoda]|eukprot:XP_020529675.1 aspartic proteinase CDR1 [Amborella trichopoda]
MRQAGRRFVSYLQYLTSVLDEKRGAKAPASGYYNEYLMPVAIGSPLRIFPLLIDTGSNLIWSMCQPCGSCESGNPIFDPKASSSYKKISCSDSMCKMITTNCTNDCTYRESYRDGSYTNGILSSDMFTFHWNETSIKPLTTSKTNSSSTISAFDDMVKISVTTYSIVELGIGGILFGCGTENKDPYTKSGVFGGGTLSFISQLAPFMPKKFSYCFPPQPEGQGVMLLGEYAEINSPKVQSTPIYRRPFADTFHFLFPVEIYVGPDPVHGPISFFDSTINGSKTFVIDFGSIITCLNREVYDPLIKLLRDNGKKQWVPDPLLEYDLCYKNGSSGEIPSVSFIFHGGATWEVSPDGLFGRMGGGLMCLIIKLSDSISTFGKLM